MWFKISRPIRPIKEGVSIMQPIIGKIEQLMNRPKPPSGGSGVPDKPCFDLAKLDEAQQKADKLKATLLEIQKLSDNIATTLADQIAQLIIHAFAQALQCSNDD